MKTCLNTSIRLIKKLTAAFAFLVFTTSSFAAPAPDDDPADAAYSEGAQSRLIFNHTDIENGRKMELSKSPETKSSAMTAHLFAETLISTGMKPLDPSEPTVMDALGVCTLDLYFEPDEKESLKVEIKLTLKYPGGKTFSGTQKWVIPDEEMEDLLGGAEVKAYRVKFVGGAVAKIMVEGKLPAGFENRFAPYLDRMIQELMIKIQPSFLETLRDYSKLQDDFWKEFDKDPTKIPVKGEKTELEKTAEGSAQASASDDIDKMMQDLSTFSNSETALDVDTVKPLKESAES